MLTRLRASSSIRLRFAGRPPPSSGRGPLAARGRGLAADGTPAAGLLLFAPAQRRPARAAAPAAPSRDVPREDRPRVVSDPRPLRPWAPACCLLGVAASQPLDAWSTERPSLFAAAMRPSFSRSTRATSQACVSTWAAWALAMAMSARLRALVSLFLSFAAARAGMLAALGRGLAALGMCGGRWVPAAPGCRAPRECAAPERGGLTWAQMAADAASFASHPWALAGSAASSAPGAAPSPSGAGLCRFCPRHQPGVPTPPWGAPRGFAARARTRCSAWPVAGRVPCFPMRRCCARRHQARRGRPRGRCPTAPPPHRRVGRRRRGCPPSRWPALPRFLPRSLHLGQATAAPSPRRPGRGTRARAATLPMLLRPPSPARVRSWRRPAAVGGSSARRRPP
jgi:hypothetical protein